MRARAHIKATLEFDRWNRRFAEKRDANETTAAADKPSIENTNKKEQLTDIRACIRVMPRESSKVEETRNLLLRHHQP